MGNINKIFLHSSDNKLPVGTTLLPDSNYEDKWSDLTSYSVLEKFRPLQHRPQKESVFCVSNNEDLEYCGGGESFVFVVMSEGNVTKHDMNWATEISMLVGDNIPDDDPRYAKFAAHYWSGDSAEIIGSEPVWEYMMDKAKILKVYDFDTDVDLDAVARRLQEKHEKNSDHSFSCN